MAFEYGYILTHRRPGLKKSKQSNRTSYNARDRHRWSSLWLIGVAFRSDFKQRLTRLAIHKSRVELDVTFHTIPCVLHHQSWPISYTNVWKPCIFILNNAQNIAKVRNCPDITIIYSCFILFVFSFILSFWSIHIVLYCYLFVFLSSHHADQICEGSQVSYFTPCVQILNWQLKTGVRCWRQFCKFPPQATLPSLEICRRCCRHKILQYCNCKC